jgi:predicted RNA binding protein YcfA (HicA-like mRNA interferase family)
VAKTYSGKQVVSILCQKFGFYFVSQKGGHVKLRKQTKNKIVTTIVPMHRELSRGTLRGVLELAEITEQEFIRAK